MLTTLLLRNQSHHLGFAEPDRFPRSRSLGVALLVQTLMRTERIRLLLD